MKEIVLAKYGELSLKGQNRSMFETQLLKTIRRRVRDAGEFKIYKAQSTVYIEPLDEHASVDKAYERLMRVFGIASANRALITQKDVGMIAADACEYLRDRLNNSKTFKVSCKRSDKSFPLNSMEISRDVGEVILHAFPHLSVSMKVPDCEVVVEIREVAAYIHSGKATAAGGMPSGTSGRALALLSGGFDSPVAMYLMAKRGLDIVGIHFKSPPYTSEFASDKVTKLAGVISSYAGNIPLVFVPFTDVMVRIRQKCPEPLFTILMRRSMMRISAAVAEKEGCKAIITGDSLGQVASQTLDAIRCVDEAVKMPVFRPLIGMDKVGIIALAREIGTYDISVLPYEDCCTVFVPRHPKTKPKLDDVIKAEQLGMYADLEAAATDGITIKVLHFFDNGVNG